MDSFVEIESEISLAIEKRRQLILTAMDGRTQRDISKKTGIEETILSKWVNGIGKLEEYQLDKLSEVLKTDFK